MSEIREQSVELREVMNEIAKMSLHKRPDVGSIGRSIQLRTNHFAIQFKNGIPVVEQYHVECTHERRKLNKQELRQVFWSCVADNKEIFQTPYAVAFDGVHLAFTVAKLQFPRSNDGSGNSDRHRFEVEVLLQRDDRPSRCAVIFQYTHRVIVDPNVVSSTSSESNATPIQIIDVVFRQFHLCPFISTNFVPAGRGFYSRPSDKHPDWDAFWLSGGRMIYPGFFNSAHIGSGWKPLMNIDSSQTAFYEAMPVVDFMCLSLQSSAGSYASDRWQRDRLDARASLDDSERKRFERDIKGLKVEVTYRKDHAGKNMVFRVNGLTRTGARQTRFVVETQNTGGSTSQGARELTVEEYFRQMKFATQLQFPNLSCLHVGARSRTVFLPMEMCSLVPDQKCNRKLTEQQTSLMIKYACANAPRREQRIRQMVKESNIGKDKFVRTFGMDLTLRQVEVNGRVLTAPALAYRTSETGAVCAVSPRDGAWRFDRCHGRLSGTCLGWSLIAFIRPEKKSDIEHFTKELHKSCKFFGLSLPQWPDCVKFTSNPRDLMALMTDCIAKTPVVRRGGKCEMIVVVVPRQNSTLYGEIKRISEVELGVATQVVLSKTVVQAKSQTLNNLVLKMNAKLGGVNQAFLDTGPDTFIKAVLLSSPTLFLGVDVTHPGSNDTQSPSIASIVGNVDLCALRYGSTMKVQKRRRENIVDLVDAVRERLAVFYKTTGQKPHRIILYRDGVPESQFQDMLREEVTSIHKACTLMESDYKPPITFVVVQKRHHTRFFCVNQSDACGKAMNVPPGTVVDSGIAHPHDFDFYLCSHFGIQGTSRPSHYYVLHDDASFSADDIQRMTYYLCHIYCRCPRSVSIPAPVYYAGLACTRARYHLINSCGLPDTGSIVTEEDAPVAGTAETGALTETQLLSMITLQDALRNTMYFA